MSALPPIGSGRPLVYLPGLDGSGELLFCQEEEIGACHRLLRIPSRTSGAFDYTDLIRDVLETLDDHRIDRATFVAESFGGTVGLQLALEYPECVERLVIVNSFPYFQNRGLLRWGKLLTRVAPAPVVQGVRVLVDTPMLYLEGVPADARRRFLEIAYRQPLEGYVRRLELLESLDLRNRLGEIRVPTLVVASELDRVVPSDEARLMASKIPGAALRVFPGIGHALFLTPGISLVRILDEWGSPGSAAHPARAS